MFYRITLKVNDQTQHVLCFDSKGSGQLVAATAPCRPEFHGGSYDDLYRELAAKGDLQETVEFMTADEFKARLGDALR